MASLSDFECLDEEVKELLQNYKHKKATVYEPCTLKNFRECLIGLHEELSLLNINYIFNPYVDLDDDTLRPDALVKLINSVWTLLHHYKAVADKSEQLVEQNHILELNNNQLNGSLNRLKNKLTLEKNEARACVATAQRLSDRSDEVFHDLTEARAKLIQLTKQKNAIEKGLRNEITRLRQENDKLTDRIRSKSGVYTPCSEVCDSTVVRLKEREKKQQAVIAQLQANNQELLREVLALKEELILGGIQDFKFESNRNLK